MEGDQRFVSALLRVSESAFSPFFGVCPSTVQAAISKIRSFSRLRIVTFISLKACLAFVLLMCFRLLYLFFFVFFSPELLNYGSQLCISADQ